MQQRSNNRRSLVLLAIAAFAVFITGCKRPFDTPEYVTVESFETAFVVPLEGDVQKQVKFDSIESIEEARVAVRRLQIPHRWSQTGKGSAAGEWIDTLQVIKVNRTPVTREWEAPETGAKVTAQTANAIWMESKDSIGFSTGFTVSAFIKEGDAARFLYNYPASSLSDVIDRDMKARIAIAAAGFAAGHDMAALRSMKAEMTAALNADLIGFYADRGITITTVGLIGGFTYDNPAVQEAIDRVFQAQQAVQVETANAAAQIQRNVAIESKAIADANARKQVGDAEAYAVEAKYMAEAAGVAAVNKALAEAGNNPLVVELRRVERWDGKYPYMMLGGGQGPNLLLKVPDAPGLR